MNFLKNAFGHHDNDENDSAVVPDKKTSTLSPSEVQETADKFQSQNNIGEDSSFPGPYGSSYGSNKMKPSSEGELEPPVQTEGYDIESTYGKDEDDRESEAKKKPVHSSIGSNYPTHGLDDSNNGSSRPVKSSYDESPYEDASDLKPVKSSGYNQGSSYGSYKNPESESFEDSNPPGRTSGYEQFTAYGQDDDRQDSQTRRKPVLGGVHGGTPGQDDEQGFSGTRVKPVKTGPYGRSSGQDDEVEDSAARKPVHSGHHGRSSENSSHESDDCEKPARRTSGLFDSDRTSKYTENESGYRKPPGVDEDELPYEDSDSSFNRRSQKPHRHESEEYPGTEDSYEDSQSSFKPPRTGGYGVHESKYDETPVTTFESYAQEEEVGYGRAPILEEDSVPIRSSPHGHEPAHGRASKIALATHRPEAYEDSQSEPASFRSSTNYEDL